MGGDVVWINVASNVTGGNGDFFVSGKAYRAVISLYPLPGYAFDPECFEGYIIVVGSSSAGYVRGPEGVMKIEVNVQGLPGLLVVDFYFNPLP
jgi:hypothetical protein